MCLYHSYLAPQPPHSAADLFGQGRELSPAMADALPHVQEALLSFFEEARSMGWLGHSHAFIEVRGRGAQAGAVCGLAVTPA